MESPCGRREWLARRVSQSLSAAMLKLPPEIVSTAEVHELPGGPHCIVQARLPEYLPGGQRQRFQLHEEDCQQFQRLQTSTTRLLLAHGTVPHDSVPFMELSGYTDELCSTMYLQALPAQIMSRSWAILQTIGCDMTLDCARNSRSFFGGGIVAADFLSESLDHLISTELSMMLPEKHSVRSLASTHHLPFVDLFPWARKSPEDYSWCVTHLRHYLQISRPMVILTLGDKATNLALRDFREQLTTAVSMLEVVGSLKLRQYDDPVASSPDDNYCIVVPCFHPGHLRYANPAQENIGRIVSKTLAVAWFAAGTAIRYSLDHRLTKREICQNVIADVLTSLGPGTEFGKTFSRLKAAYSDSQKKMVPGTQNPQQSSTPANPLLMGRRVQKSERQIRRQLFSTSSQFVRNQGPSLDLQRSTLLWRTGLEELHEIMAYGIAEGGPNSRERLSQCDQLYSVVSTSRLVGRIPVESAHSFRKWLLKLPGNQAIYFAATSPKDHVERIPNLLELHLASTADSRDQLGWREHEDLILQASKALVAWVHTELVVPNKPSEQTIMRISARYQMWLDEKDSKLAMTIRESLFQPTRDIPDLYTINGQRVKVHPVELSTRSSVLMLKWKDDQQSFSLDDLRLPMGCLPLGLEDVRTIHFVPEGIDIRNQAGFTLGLAPGRKATLPLYDLVTVLARKPFSREFLSLWERETSLTLDERLFGTPSLTTRSPAQGNANNPLDPRFFTGRSLPYDTSNNRQSKEQKLQELRRQLPLQPGDALWLLNKFLEEMYPTGGPIDLSNPDVWPESRSVWPELEGWLAARTTYHNHPQRLNLMGVCGLSRDKKYGKGCSAYFQVAVQVLRPPVTIKAGEVKRGASRRYRIIATVADRLPEGVVTSTDLPQVHGPRLDSTPMEGPEGMEDQDGMRHQLASARRSLISSSRRIGDHGEGMEAKDSEADSDMEMLLT